MGLQGIAREQKELGAAVAMLLFVLLSGEAVILTRPAYSMFCIKEAS